jgi:hypothetical protein
MVIRVRPKTAASHCARALSLVLVFATAVACNTVVGIERATLDPYTCAGYCAIVGRNCTGQSLEYDSAAVCEAMCKTFEVGQESAPNGDTLACRSFYALQAPKDPKRLCPQAGPLGGGVCSKLNDPCFSFCELGFAQCNANDNYPFASVAECQSKCPQIPYLRSGINVDASVPVGDLISLSGNTLNCRLTHLQKAYEANNPLARSQHCGHIGTVNNPRFSTPCR